MNWIVSVAGLGELTSQKEKVREVVGETGFCVIRGVFDPGDVQAEYERISHGFSPANDIRRSGPVVRNMKNFQRLDCGEYAQVNARFSRMLTRFFWNPDDHFSSHFRTLQEVRDVIAGREIAYAHGCYQWNGQEYHEIAKILQYPRGGGFLNEHYDSYNNDGLFNIGMSVTKKGVHFSGGGIYYKSRNGEECSIDDALAPGDIYVHDEMARHGVHAIDPHSNIDLSTFSGRITLILSSETFKGDN